MLRISDISITKMKKTFLNLLLQNLNCGDNVLTWPTSAGAIVEFIFSTACETPVTDRL